MKVSPSCFFGAQSKTFRIVYTTGKEQNAVIGLEIQDLDLSCTWGGVSPLLEVRKSSTAILNFVPIMPAMSIVLILG